MEKTEFRNTEIVDGPKEHRAHRSYGLAHSWMCEVAREGREHPAFCTPGWWRPGDGGSRDRRVMEPWIYFDIDKAPEDSVEDVYPVAVRLICDLHRMGLPADEGYMFASFSGGKGFHVMVSSAYMGLPWFRNAGHAHRTLKTFFSDLAKRYPELDAKVWSPLIPIRLTGSRHAETGRRKWTMRADRFAKRPEEIAHLLSAAAPPMVEQVARPEFVAEFPHPFEPEPDADLRAAFAEVWKAQVRPRGEEASQRGGRDGHTYDNELLMPDAHYRAWQGVAESEAFAVGHHGRDEAAFMLACHFLRTTRTPEEVVDLLKRWDLQRNTPPLQEDPSEPHGIIETKVRSAARKLYEDGEIAEPARV